VKFAAWESKINAIDTEQVIIRGSNQCIYYNTCKTSYDV